VRAGRVLLRADAGYFAGELARVAFFERLPDHVGAWRSRPTSGQGPQPPGLRRDAEQGLSAGGVDQRQGPRRPTVLCEPRPIAVSARWSASTRRRARDNRRSRRPAARRAGHQHPMPQHGQLDHGLAFGYPHAAPGAMQSVCGWSHSAFRMMGTIPSADLRFLLRGVPVRRI
jgi:hypothetical protein